jgi:predicted Zn-dependent peptidase
VEFKEKTLANGLQLIGEVNAHAKTAAVGFFVKSGSRDETPDVSGVSHFLEHMMFKGTEDMDALEVNAAFDATGAQFNAFTSEEQTVYYASMLPEYLAKVTGLWIDVMRPSLRDEDFDLEKNVIKEEIAMYQDMPNFEVMDGCRALHFESHPCGNSVLGTVDSIDALTSQQMRDYFSQRYAPNNMILVWTGNFQWDQMVAMAEQRCTSWQAQDVSRSLSHFPGSYKTDRLVQPTMAREHICLMSQGLSFQDKQRYAGSLLTAILGDDTCSRYYWALVDKALAETAVMSLDTMDGTGMLYSYLKCSSERLDQVLDVVRTLLKEAKHEGITEDELRIAKNKKLSALVIRNELPMGRLIDLGFTWAYLKTHRLIQDDIDAIKAVTVQDIGTLMDEIDPSRFTLYSMGPRDN